MPVSRAGFVVVLRCVFGQSSCSAVVTPWPACLVRGRVFLFWFVQLDKMEEAGLMRMPFTEPLFQFKFPE